MAENTRNKLIYGGRDIYVEAAKNIIDEDGNAFDINDLDNRYITTDIVDQKISENVSAALTTVMPKVVRVEELPETDIETHYLYYVDGTTYARVENEWLTIGNKNNDFVLKKLNGQSLIGDGNITFRTINGESIFGIGDISITPGESSSTRCFEIVSDPTRMINTNKLYLYKADGAEYYDIYVVINIDESNVPVCLTTGNDIDKEEIKADIVEQLSNEFATKSEIPTDISDLNGTTNLATIDYVDSKISNNTTATLLSNIDADNICFACDSEVKNLTANNKTIDGDIQVKKYVSKINQSINYHGNMMTREIFDRKLPDITDTIKIDKYDIDTNVLDETFVISYDINGNISLLPGFKYVLSGNFTHSINITNATSDKDTLLVLSGVILKTPTQAINFLPTSGTCHIELGQGTSNIVWNMASANGSSRLSYGAIMSEDANIIIRGTGNLMIKSNTGFHGIKAKKVTVAGNPKLNIMAIHDGIHASQLVNIQNGELFITDCHNGIDSSNSDNTKGKVIISGGKLVITNCDVGIKQANYSNERYSSGLIANSDCTIYIYNCITDLSNITILEDVTTNLQKTAFIDYYGVGIVRSGKQLATKAYEFESGMELGVENDIYTFDAAGYTGALGVDEEVAIEISGYIENPISIERTDKCQVVFNNAYIATELGRPSIVCQNEDLRIIINENTVNYVTNNCNEIFDSLTDYDAIKCEEDVRIKGNGCIVVSSYYGDGLDGSKFELTDGSSIYAHNCGECGIKGTTLYFGGKDDEKEKNGRINIYAHNNGLYHQENYKVPVADIYARNGKCTKGSYIIWDTYRGCAIVESFKTLKKNDCGYGESYNSSTSSVVTHVSNLNKNIICYEIENNGEYPAGTFNKPTERIDDKKNLIGSYKYSETNKKNIALYDYSDWNIIRKEMPYKSIKQLSDYLFYMEYEYVDQIYAQAYIDRNYQPVTGCTAVRKDNYYGRNLDWFYGNEAAIIIHMPKNGNRHETLAVADSSPTLTKEFIESGDYHDIYKVLPYMVVDGINDCGVVANVNVVPDGQGGFGVTGTCYAEIEEKAKICMVQIPRYVIDNFSSAQDAVEYLRDYVTIYPTKSISALGYSSHFMIADKYNTYVIEFIARDGQTTMNIIDLSNSDIKCMANFYLTDVEFNQDHKVYCPETNTDTNNAHDTNKITYLGSGLERYNYVVDKYYDIESKEDMITLMEGLKYSNAYKLDEFGWFTEFVGLNSIKGDPNSPMITVNSRKDDLLEKNIVDRMRTAFNNRVRGEHSTWMTTHTSIFDINAKTLTVFSQENYDTRYDFKMSNTISIPVCDIARAGSYYLVANVNEVGDVQYNWWILPE